SHDRRWYGPSHSPPPDDRRAAGAGTLDGGITDRLRGTGPEREADAGGAVEGRDRGARADLRPARFSRLRDPHRPGDSRGAARRARQGRRRGRGDHGSFAAACTGVSGSLSIPDFTTPQFPINVPTPNSQNSHGNKERGEFVSYLGCFGSWTLGVDWELGVAELWR